MKLILGAVFVLVSCILPMNFCDNDAALRNCDTAKTCAKCIETNKPLKHFWKSTGLSPPDPNNAHAFLQSIDERFNLIFIGSLPHQGIRQVRIHWLLNLITYNESGKEYNFGNLDTFLDFMRVNTLRPGFELMGLPLNIKPEQTKRNIYKFWFNLVETIGHRYIARFGYEEVQKWRFETMNEPDLKQYNFLNFTLPEYLQYFKACTDALNNVSNVYTGNGPEMTADHSDNQLIPSAIFNQTKRESSQAGQAAKNSKPNQQGIRLGYRIRNKSKRKSPARDWEIKMTGSGGSDAHEKIQKIQMKAKKMASLRVGGPAGLFKQRDRHPLCWGLLDMCNRTVCHLHYVSFHKKGGGSAAQVLNEDLALLGVLQEYGFMGDMPIANDEADILTNWSLDERWRADVWYAALMSKVIIDHYKELILKRNVTIEVLSNDNAFLNYHPHFFTQRTLLARFQMNNTTPQHVQFIKKPVYVAMGLLAMLGDEYLPTVNFNLKIHKDKRNEDENVFVLYTKRTSQYSNVLSMLLVAVTDKTNRSHTKTTNKRQNIAITLEFNMEQIFSCHHDVDLEESSVMMIYALDNDKTNPYKVWQAHKSPDFPDKDLRKLMRQNEGPVKEKAEFLKRSGNDDNVMKLSKIKLSLKIPSIHLINICVDPTMNIIPGAVINLRGYYVTHNEVLLTWNDKRVRSRCIKTYEVEYQAHQNATFQRLNADDLILLSYQHDNSNLSFGPVHKWAKNDEQKVQYRVRAVDYWDRPGPYSNVIGNAQIIQLA